MKIAVAQTRPVPGDIPANIERHLNLIELAVSNNAELVVFPELSITGYEPLLATDLAIDPNDQRLAVFQRICDSRRVTIGIGAPTKHSEGTRISLLLFQPERSRHVYSKMYLHSSEEHFFVPGPPVSGLIGADEKIALAICYEVSVPEHAANASQNGAEIYLASVADSVEVMDRVLARLSSIARDYSMTTLMANCVGRCHDWEAAGRTSVWNENGVLLSQLSGTQEGLIVIDTNSNEVAQLTLDAVSG